MIKRKLSAIVLLCAMLAIGNVAWSSTLYLFMGDNDNYTGYTNKGSVTASSEYEWDMGSLTSGKNYFFFVSTTSSYTGMIASTDASKIIDGSSILSSKGIQNRDSYNFNRISLSSAATITLTYNSSAGTYTISTGSVTYTVTPSVTGGTIDPDDEQEVEPGSSISFTVTPTSGYTYSTATYDGGVSGSISKSGDTFSFTPTGSGTFSVTYSLKYTVTPSVTGGTVSPSTAQSVTAGSSVAFTVTPTSGFSYVSASYSGTKSGEISKFDNTFTLTPTSNGTLSIVYAGTSAPTVRIGEKPRFSDCALTVGAYVAQTGCVNITAFNLQYSNNSMFRYDGNYKTDTKNQTVSSPAINSNTDITLTSNEVEQVVKPGETLYLRVNATNGSLSQFSDVVSVKYECNRFVTKNLSKTFRACPGEHQFKWSEMFLSPEPTTWSCTLGGSDATSDFSLVDGQMIWNTTGKTGTSYEYEFTAKKDGYSDANATLTITYSVPPASTGSISTLTATPNTNVTPYQAVALIASGTQGDINLVEWTSTPASATFSNISGNTVDGDEPTATFRANKVGSAIDYTVTVTGYNTTNCSSASRSVTISVKPDEAEDCD